MKKTAMFLAALTLVSGTAFGAINLEVRGDYNNAAKYANTTNQDVNAMSYFSFQRAKLKLTGNLNDSVSYRLRFDFSKYNTATDSSGTNYRIYPFVDNAEVSHKVVDFFALTVGKLSDSNMSAWEGQTSGGDMYLTSQAYSYPNLIGLKLDFVFDTHGVYLYAYDNNEGSYVGSTKYGDAVNTNISRMGMGVAYKGWLLDKTLGLMLSYHILPYYNYSATNTPVSERDDVFTAFGVQYKLDALLAEFDYLMKNAQKSVSMNGEYANKTTNSAVLTVKYSFGAFTPVLKVDMSTLTGDAVGTSPNQTSVTDNVTNYGLALEYKPFEENFRYHVAYTTKATKYASDRAYTNGTVTQSYIVAGLKINHDLVK